MNYTAKLTTNDWIFARNFAYIDGQHEPYVYKKNIFGKNKIYEPNQSEMIPYLIIDDVGMMVNHLNQKGKWMFWNWEDTKSLRIYELMHPWKASIFQWISDADFYRERRKTKKYLRIMRRKYKDFDYNYEEQYKSHYSLLFEGKKGNGQIWIPKEWVEDDKKSWFLEKIEEKSEKTIKYFNTEEDWRKILIQKPFR